MNDEQTPNEPRKEVPEVPVQHPMRETSVTGLPEEAPMRKVEMPAPATDPSFAEVKTGEVQ